MASQGTDSPQHGPNAGQCDDVMLNQGENVPHLESSHFPTGRLHSLVDVPRHQPQNDIASKSEHKRGPSQSSLDTLKLQPETFREKDSGQPKDKLSLVGPRASMKTRPGKAMPLSVPSQPPDGPLHPPVNEPTNLRSAEELRASPLDALLSPTTTPLSQTQSFPRDSVAGSDLSEVRLDDDERFSTVSLNAAATATRDSTVAIKSPVDETASKPWAEEEPAPAPSEISSTSVRASFSLQRFGNDGVSGTRRSLDGQQKFQEVFERAQRDSKELEGDLANVDWGKCPLVSFAQKVYSQMYSFLGFRHFGYVKSNLLRPSV